MLLQSSNENLQKRFHDLPWTLQESWGRIVEDTEKSKVFQDITHAKKRSHQLIDSYETKNYKLAMNDFCFPSNMCFCGSTEFIDTVGKLPFHHLLNYLDPKFLSFKANWRKNVHAIRPDYLDETSLKLPFEVKPTIAVGEDGLMLATCSFHKNGSNLKFFHVPRYPVTANLSHPFSDRLAPLCSTFRGATPCRVGEFSNTWTMSKPLGGQKGIGSLTVHSSRSKAVVSDVLLPTIESIFLNNRADLTETMNQLASEYNLNEELLNTFYHKEYAPTEEQTLNAIKSATYVPIGTAFKIKQN